MKKTNYRKLRLFRPVAKLAFFLSVALLSQYAKSSPTLPKQRRIAFTRAKMLDNGISISWLEQTWNKNMLTTDGIKPADLQLLKQLGFKTIRLPVAFRYFEKSHVPQQQVLARVDKVWALCRQYGFKLIIDYHYGDLADSNYVSATKNIINTWTIIAKKYLHTDANALFYEIYNEPPPMNPQLWKDAAYNIVNAIRKIDKRRTLLVGASNYNSIYELSRFVRLPDENIIYTFHFYEPFLFTHQGAEWVGDQMATTGVPFPYNVEKFPAMNIKAKGTPGEANYNKYRLDGNERSVKDKLQIIKNWGNKYAVPIICGEYGSYNKYADEQSRCNYVNAVRKSLKLLNIPGILWDYNTNFSLFNGPPSLANLSDCMKQALSE
jgi:endoglucanase